MTDYAFPSGFELPTDLGRAIKDIRTAHPLMQQRWANLEPVLKGNGFPTIVNEVWRPDLRQQWLWAQGRSAVDCAHQNVPIKFARPGKIVTNSSHAWNSAHGWCVKRMDGKVVPAACAIDVVPVGPDGKPWTKDDPWEAWLALVDRDEVKALGLVHFAKPGKKPWDVPHLQLAEWSDKEKRPIL